MGKYRVYRGSPQFLFHNGDRIKLGGRIVNGQDVPEPAGKLEQGFGLVSFQNYPIHL